MEITALSMLFLHFLKKKSSRFTLNLYRSNYSFWVFKYGS